MLKQTKHIEIVCTTQTVLSSMSQESRDAILAVLTKHYTRVGITIINNLEDLEALVSAKPDLVFLGMKFIPVNPALGIQDPNRIWISDYLDMHDIAYTGSGQEAHELEINKNFAKQCVLDAGLKTSPFMVARRAKPIKKAEVTLGYPLFVKPTNRGGGLGIDADSVVNNFEELQAKVKSITSNQQSDSLIEQYLPGREFSVAILKNDYSEDYAVMPIELVAPPSKKGARLLSDEVKTSNAEAVLEVTDEPIRAKVTKLALDVFYALGARDYGRIDIRLDQSGTPQFLEANLLPSLICGYGSFPKACLLNIALDYEPMIVNIVELAFSRSADFDEDAVVDIESDLALPSFLAV